MTTQRVWNTERIRSWRSQHPGERLDLSNADLRRADLRRADLRYAYLRYVDLRRVDLRYADLRYADLTGARLKGVNLMDADLRGAKLTDAKLTDADLTHANLAAANFTGANLTGANLAGAYLKDTNLYPNHVWQFGPFGSRRDYLVVKQGPNLDEVSTGCFQGTLAQFEAAVVKTHGDDQFGKEYQAIIAAIKELIAFYAAL